MSKVVIRQDELQFLYNLVAVKLNVLDTDSSQFSSIDTMEDHVKEYRMAQDIHGRLSKAMEGIVRAEVENVDNDNDNNNTNNITGE